MKTTLGLFFALAGLIFITACGGNGKDNNPTDGADTIAATRIRAMEDSLYAQPKVDLKKAQALLDVYLLYAKVHPLDSLTPEYVFRAASMKVSLGDPQGGILLYDRIIDNYPTWRKLPDAYYLKAFTMDNGLHQKGAAQLAYQAVIDRFPDDHLAKDAKQMIANLQYTDEELIKKFESMNADSAKAQASAGK